MSHRFEKLFLGAGAMKAGTTWLYGLLSKHPDIWFTPEKEIHYFAHLHTHEKPLTLERRMNQFKRFAAALKTEDYNPRWVRRRLDWFARWLMDPLDDEWYGGLFRGIKPSQYATDFSNLTCLIDDAGWEHARSLTGDLRVLYIIRNPLDRLWSHIKFHLRVTGQSEKLDTWSDDELTAFARSEFIWQNGEYGKRVDCLRRNLKPHELKIAFFEDIHEEPVAWLRELCQFLNIPELEATADAASKPVNTTEKSPVPAALRTKFADDWGRILRELQSSGLSVPDSYKVLLGW
jgi:hypothetical protein